MPSERAEDPGLSRPDRNGESGARDSDAPCRLWQHRRRHLAIPEGLSLSRGGLEIRRGLGRAYVRDSEILPCEIDADTARALARRRIDEGAGAIAELARRFLDAHPQAAGPVRELLQRMADGVPAEGSPERRQQAEALASGAERFAVAWRDPQRRATLEARIAAASRVRLDENPALRAPMERFATTMRAVAPGLAAGLSEAAARLEGVARQLGDMPSADEP